MRPKTLIAVATLAALNSPLGAAKAVDSKAYVARAVTRDVRDDFTKHTPGEIRAAITPADINADGIQDWQVDFNSLGAAWCGTGGCRYQLWLGRRNAPPLRVFDRQMRELEIERRGGRIVYVFDFHGSECGGFGSEACPGEFTWSARRGRMVLLPTPKRHTSTTNPIDPDM